MKKLFNCESSNLICVTICQNKKELFKYIYIYIYIYIYEKTKQKHVNVVSRKVRYFSSPRFLYFFVNLRASLPLQPMKIGCQVTFVRILFSI